jgi:hypothetical protein
MWNLTGQRVVLAIFFTFFIQYFQEVDEKPLLYAPLLFCITHDDLQMK